MFSVPNNGKTHLVTQEDTEPSFQQSNTHILLWESGGLQVFQGEHLLFCCPNATTSKSLIYFSILTACLHQLFRPLLFFWVRFYSLTPCYKEWGFLSSFATNSSTDSLTHIPQQSCSPFYLFIFNGVNTRSYILMIMIRWLSISHWAMRSVWIIFLCVYFLDTVPGVLWGVLCLLSVTQPSICVQNYGIHHGTI